MEIEIRNASIEDAEFVAWVVCQAIDIEAEMDALPADIIDVCRRTDTLYSWTHTRLLVVDGKVAGGFISYGGKDYMHLRENTLKLCPPTLSKIEKSEPECTPEEYYLDSMALLPEYRGQSLSRHLMLDGIRSARENGYAYVSLIVSPAKPGLFSYYGSLGFQKNGSMVFQNKNFHRMRLKLC